MLLASSDTDPKLNFLKQRLQFGFDAAQEARSLVEEKQYTKAARSFADALNLGRKAALELQELDMPEDSGDPGLQREALDWLITVCCDSALLNLKQLEDLDSARGDAWAACVFSQYRLRQPLECMMQVCRQGNDLFGEFQACQQMLNLPVEELSVDDDERKLLSNRLKELERLLSTDR
jgi:hypothetical protein